MSIGSEASISRISAIYLKSPCLCSDCVFVEKKTNDSKVNSLLQHDALDSIRASLHFTSFHFTDTEQTQQDSNKHSTGHSIFQSAQISTKILGRSTSSAIKSSSAPSGEQNANTSIYRIHGSVSFFVTSRYTSTISRFSRSYASSPPSFFFAYLRVIRVIQTETPAIHRVQTHLEFPRQILRQRFERFPIRLFLTSPAIPHLPQRHVIPLRECLLSRGYFLAGTGLGEAQHRHRQIREAAAVRLDLLHSRG